MKWDDIIEYFCMGFLAGFFLKWLDVEVEYWHNTKGKGPLAMPLYRWFWAGICVYWRNKFGWVYGFVTNRRCKNCRTVLTQPVEGFCADGLCNKCYFTGLLQRARAKGQASSS